MQLIFSLVFIVSAIFTFPLLIGLISKEGFLPFGVGVSKKAIAFSVMSSLFLFLHFFFSFSWALIPYLLFLFFLGLFGLKRLIVVGLSRLEEALISIGLSHLFVASIWLASTLFESPLLGFSEPWKSLTAIHFHYSACFSLCLFGFFGRELKVGFVRSLWRIASLLSIVMIWLLALGISFSETLELFAAIGLSLCFMINSSLFIIKKSLIFKIAGVCNFIAMTLSIGFALDHYGLIDIPIDLYLMVKSHGAINAFLFVPLCLIGFSQKSSLRKPNMPHFSPPFSKLKTNQLVDSSIVESMGWGRVNFEGSCTGILDSMQELETSEFNAKEVDERISDFYLNTDSWEMKIDSEWRNGFSFLSRFWNYLASFLGQMSFPTKLEDLETQIIPINDKMDGRRNVRAWVRNYKGSKKTIYAAFYSTHSLGSQKYMNIAFPFQLGNLTSILKFIRVSSKEIDITTKSRTGSCGDEGIYFVHPKFFLRLPMNETIRVWVDEKEEGFALKATHSVWIFGLNFLNLSYSLTKIR